MMMTSETTLPDHATGCTTGLNPNGPDPPVFDAALLVGSDLGSLNPVALDRLSNQLERMVSEGHRRIVVDLSDVSEIGAAGLGILVRAHQELAERSGELIVVGDPLDALQRTGLDRVIAVWNSMPPSPVPVSGVRCDVSDDTAPNNADGRRSRRFAEPMWLELDAIGDAFPDTSSALTEAVRRIANRLEVDVCSVYAVHDHNSLVLTATMGLKQFSVGHVQMTFAEGLVGLVAQQLEPVLTPDAQQHPRFLHFPDAGEEAFASFLGVPVMRAGHLRGVLVVQTTEPRDFLSDWAAIALAAQEVASVL